MTRSARRTKQPNQQLAQLISACGASRKSLAHRINELARMSGIDRQYTHTSVSNWADHGMTPRPPVPSLVARALGERLGRHVSLSEIGMDSGHGQDAPTGLEFPRNPGEAVRTAADFWSHVDRRSLISTFAVSAYTAPFTRWLVQPAAAATAPPSGRRIGPAEVTELWDVVRDVQRWDSKYGGGSWRARQATEALALRAVPLLDGTCTDTVRRRLCTATAELARVAAWAAVDAGHHEAAQRHFIQALSIARAGGDIEMGCYVLSTMSLQTVLRGYPSEAIDMAQGAYQRAKGRAAPRVLAFARLMEARAHASARDARAASSALTAAETLLSQTRTGTEPPWIANVTHARLAADATEMWRDLRNPKAALAWHAQADTMSPDRFTRSVGLRLTAAAIAHLQTRNLDQGLAAGHQAIDLLARVQSARARDYIRSVTTALAPWQKETRTADFIHRARTELTPTG
ncbi:sporulation protein [Streptomyces sp. NPDC056244]|uniref:sporulation protein n=1 Tax=Streptomyces sp. NPDC056244 TaxID=3345762 RepID=UPI0035DADF57